MTDHTELSVEKIRESLHTHRRSELSRYQIEFLLTKCEELEVDNIKLMQYNKDAAQAITDLEAKCKRLEDALEAERNDNMMIME